MRWLIQLSDGRSGCVVMGEEIGAGAGMPVLSLGLGIGGDALAVRVKASFA